MNSIDLIVRVLVMVRGAAPAGHRRGTEAATAQRGREAGIHGSLEQLLGKSSPRYFAVGHSL